MKRRTNYGILFIFNLLFEYINLEYVRMHVICRVNLAEYAICIPMAAPQEYVNIYSTRRVHYLCRLPRRLPLRERQQRLKFRLKRRVRLVEQPAAHVLSEETGARKLRRAQRLIHRRLDLRQQVENETER